MCEGGEGNAADCHADEADEADEDDEDGEDDACKHEACNFEAQGGEMCEGDKMCEGEEGNAECCHTDEDYEGDFVDEGNEDDTVDEKEGACNFEVNSCNRNGFV